MVENFPRPVRMNSERLEGSAAMDPADQVMDPAERLAIAHETAGLLIGKGSREGTPIQVERLVAFAEENGLDILADLWSSAHPVSLPGALWRLYLVKAALSDNLADASTVFSRGIAELNTIDAAVVGAPDPLEPREFLAVLEDILRGAFDGSFPLALERASAVARAVSAGVISLTPGNDEDDRYFSKRSLRWSVIADELSLSAKQAQAGTLS